MKLFLFTSELKLAKLAEQSGIDSVMIDWEQKTAESEGADGSVDTTHDLEQLVSELEIPVSVRINGTKDHLEDEVNIACEYGAQYIMLPMAKHEDDIYKFIDLVNGRAQTIIQIETQQLVNRLDKIHNLRKCKVHFKTRHVCLDFVQIKFFSQLTISCCFWNFSSTIFFQQNKSPV